MSPPDDQLGAELRAELRAVARELLAKDGSPGPSSLARAGWSGLEVPEDLDGAGATFAETAVVLEELGRAAASSPYLGVALAVGLLTPLPPSGPRDGLLRGIAGGDVTPAVALGDGGPAFRLAGGRLHGTASFVPDAAGADLVLLLASGEDGGTVAVPLAPDAAGVEVVAQPVLDATRRLGVVTATEAPEDAGSVLRPGSRAPLGERAAVALACDSLGVGEAMLDATVAYVRTREQFGRPVGSFQAVKHQCADMLVRLAVARELVSAAVAAVAAGDAEAWVAASRAKAYATAAAVDVAGTAMQLHGGMGYTWESGVHVYLKRALLNRALLGSPAEHRARLAKRFI